MKKAIYSLGLVAGLALGQQQQHDVVIFDRAIPATPTAAGRNVFFFTSSDVEKGAAYSADSITETTQVLADGNRIKNTNKSSIARDSEGRTRRESTIQMLGPVGRTEEPVVTVFIHDPVANVQYTLDTRAKLAMKTKSGGGKGIVSEKVIVERKMVRGTAEDVVVEHKIMGPEKGAQTMQFSRTTEVRMGGEMKKEDLGTRMIEGVNAKGTKMTMTIPAGEVGNERAMEVVTETWYSDEIKAMVLSKHTDPRMGETVTRLTNVKLGEPSKSLFEPPSDYKVEEVKNMRMPMEAMPAIRVREDR